MQKKVVSDLKFFVPLTGSLYFNTDETRLLGVGLALVQIDKSILSASEYQALPKTGIIMPNPSTGEVRVTLNLPYSDITNVNLYDLSGSLVKVVNRGFMSSGIIDLRFNISHLQSGSYFLRITQRDFTKTLKLVKEG